MSHEMYSDDSLIMRNTPAWHGRGMTVNEDLSPSQALVKANLNWSVGTTNVIHGEQSDGGIVISTDSWKMIYRTDNDNILAIQPKNWVVLQNSEMASDADVIATEIGGVSETFGSLKGGRIIYTAISSKFGFEVGNRGDFVKPYFILVNSHDGSKAYQGLWSGVRPVCWNTVQMALNGAKSKSWSFKHTQNMLARRESCINTVKSWKHATELYAKSVNDLAKKTLTQSQIQVLWVQMLEKMYGELPIVATTVREKNKQEKVLGALAHMSESFDRESNQFGANAWVAYNSMTNYLQHFNSSSRSEKGSDPRIQSHLWGQEADLRNAAWQLTQMAVV